MCIISLSPVSGALQIEYSATSTKKSPINLANHMYFNLAGHQTGMYRYIVISCLISYWKNKWSNLTCLINEHARLFISEKFETLPALIEPCPFIDFPNFVQPAWLLGLPIFHFVPFPLASFIDTMTKSYPII